MNIIEIHASVPKKSLERFWPDERPTFHAILSDANPKPGSDLQPLAPADSELAEKCNRQVDAKLEQAGFDEARAGLLLDAWTERERKINPFFREVEKGLKSPAPKDPKSRLERRVRNVNRWIDACQLEIVTEDGSIGFTPEERANMKLQAPRGEVKKLETVIEAKASIANFKQSHKGLEFEIY